jgi:LysM repeat protein
MNEMLLRASLKQLATIEDRSPDAQEITRQRVISELEHNRSKGLFDRAVEYTFSEIENLLNSFQQFTIPNEELANETEFTLKPFRSFAKTLVIGMQAKLVRKDRRIALNDGEYCSLYEGDQLQSGLSRVKLTFSGHASQLIDIHPQSQIAFTTLRPGVNKTPFVDLNVLIGKLQIKINRLAKDTEPLVINTHNAMLKPLGTMFNVQVLPADGDKNAFITICEVFEGQVQVSNDQGQVNVLAGQELLIENSKPLQPVQLHSIRRGEIYVSQPHDTPDEIAARFGISALLFQLANPHVGNQALNPGTLLLIPKP